MTSHIPSHPPLWGLTLSLDPDAHILIADDDPSRAVTLQPLIGNCNVIWATTINEVEIALDEHGPFDIYFLDFDLGEGGKGGWEPVANIIRQADPYSIGKVIFVHSSNINAGPFFRKAFPIAIVIQWDALSTLLGVPTITHELIDLILQHAGQLASLEELQDAAIKMRPAPDTESK